MSLLDAIPKFARGNRLKKAELKTGSNKFDPDQKIEDASLYDANLITSEAAEGWHFPLIDIDMECALIPSTTPGHYHLYIDRPMRFDNYVKLLNVMRDVGIVQPGFADGTEKRGYGSLRMPHIKKEEPPIVFADLDTIFPEVKKPEPDGVDEWPMPW